MVKCSALCVWKVNWLRFRICMVIDLLEQINKSFVRLHFRQLRWKFQHGDRDIFLSKLSRRLPRQQRMCHDYHSQPKQSCQAEFSQVRRIVDRNTHLSNNWVLSVPRWMFFKSRVGAVVRTLAFPQYGPGSTRRYIHTYIHTYILYCIAPPWGLFRHTWVLKY